MMTSAQIRQSFLDFFKSKQHTIVPSSSLLPDSPNLLFTNAGMNQFVPIFLGQTKCPYTPGRAADTQKCIRAGGKHNDLDDVGLDTYHHTFFEMLGNWSFADYFKREAIDWAWELVVGIWKFPPQRLYATVYNPDKSKNDPSEFDQEAWNFWAEKFRSVGLDPAVHIVNGSKKDNFWMMGETGPCGPCSELHVDLTPAGDTRGSLVNKGNARCIEIWNLVFIQFNANPDGTFSPLPAKHVDTGMGFERVTSIIQGTKNFSNFENAKISNYETDIFRPIFDALEKLSGKKYGSTLPKSGSAGDTEQEKIDVAFRVIADHIRTLSFAIADGIQPGNNDRNYVLRRILRRAVRYGRTLGFHEPFFHKLVDVLADTMGDVFPEIRARKKHVQETIRAEEEAFNKTLDRGIKLFNTRIEFAKDTYNHAREVERLNQELSKTFPNGLPKKSSDELVAIVGRHTKDWQLLPEGWDALVNTLEEMLFVSMRVKVIKMIEHLSAPSEFVIDDLTNLLELRNKIVLENTIPGKIAFQLYDTYGFPLDLTELMARERGLIVDKDGFEKLMEEQRARARAAQKKTVITVQEGVDLVAATEFVGYEKTRIPSRVLTVIPQQKRWGVVLTESPFYAEMGGQVGDTGIISLGASLWHVIDTKKIHSTWLHIIEGEGPPAIGPVDFVEVDIGRRNAIQRHHTVTHLLHWALHEVASKEASQKGSFVGPDKLTFDFNSQPLTPQQISDIEKLVNERILENTGVSWTEMPHADVKNRKDVMQFFGDKYGDTVRVVQIGGRAGKLDGYSMELCGGTHTRATGEIGLFRIVAEGAIAAGVRRIEAVAGLEAYSKANDELHLIKTLAGKVNSPIHELDKKIEAILAHQKELEKSLRTATMREASNAASELLERVHTLNGVPAIIHNVGSVDGDFLQAVADSLKGRFKGVIVLGSAANGAVALVASVSSDFTAKIQAGKIIQQIAPIIGGKGGGKPDNARGGGKDAGKLDEALAEAKSLIQS
jgi:alanyl-tRNA synthetase